MLLADESNGIDDEAQINHQQMLGRGVPHYWTYVFPHQNAARRVPTFSNNLGSWQKKTGSRLLATSR